MRGVTMTVTPVDWPSDLQKYDIYINEEGMYELVFGSHQPQAKPLRRHCCNAFPHIQQTLTDKMVDDLRHEYQHLIEEKDAALALITDDLQDHANQIQVIQYENMALETQRDVCQAQLQRCEDITHLRARYVDHARDPGKDNTIIIVRKHTTSTNNKYYDLPYYVCRIQRPKRYVKLRWLNQHFPQHQVIVEIDSPNNI